MTVNQLWALIVSLVGGIIGMVTLYEKAVKPRKEKRDNLIAKVERGAVLDDQYEKDHEIILTMNDTLNKIDSKLDKDYILTLRNTIMNDNLTNEERLEAYLDYKKLGGNGKVKEYAEKHFIKGKVNE